MERTKPARALRIAWTVWWGILCVLLVALWVRSYTWIDVLDGPLTTSRGILLGSSQGRLSIGDATRPHWLPKRLLSMPYDQARDTLRTHDLLSEEEISAVIPAIYGIGGPAVSHWLPILTIGTVGTLVCIGRSPRRFSVRTLLIATTLVAVGLGMVVYLAR